MSRTSRRHKAGALVAGALIGVLALAGCGAGQTAQTAHQANTSGGATATAGTIKVLDARISFTGQPQGAAVYPAGGSAPVAMHIVNTGTAADRLVGVSSPVATSVQTAGDNEILPGIPLVVQGTGTAATGTQPGTAPGESNEAQVVLAGLTEGIRPGLSYPIVLVFERAGQVRLDLPVETSAAARS